MSIIARALARISRNRPARIIHSGDLPYLYRVFLGRVLGWNFYLHQFVSTDEERWLHDHPFDGFSLVLSGGYTEERLIALSWPRVHTDRRKVRWFNYVSGDCFHRVLAPKPNTWTLFFHPPKFKGWGFLQELDDSVIYHNPFGNVADRPWWETAPTYRALRVAEIYRASAESAGVPL